MTEQKDTLSGQWPLEPDEATVRSWIDTATDLLMEHVRTLGEQPAANADVSADEVRRLVEPMPEEASEAGELLRHVVEDLVPRSFNTASPGYFAYIPGGGLLPSAIADLVANMTNRYVGMFATAPLLVRLETNVLRWFLDMVGYPEGARGILTSGGSIANLVALVCARHEKLGDHFQDGVVYVSDQVHHSVAKAARFVGFAPEQVRVIETGEDLRLTRERLLDAVAEDRRAGRRPAVVVASAGTTNTGVVDDLSGLSEFAKQEGLWLHVDAAYGGFFALTARGKERLAGMESADSITVDPHKGLFLPYGTGCLLVRDGRHLRAPHRSTTGYLPPLNDDSLAQDFTEYSPELSRDFRGLRIWLPLKIFGARAFREALDEKLDLAIYAAREIEKIPGIELLAEPDLSLVTFRKIAAQGEDVDQLNQEFLQRMLAKRKVWMSGAWVKGHFTQRICVISFRSHREDVDRALELIRTESY
jgi:aromatic-L-amino-acid/L-tryptophan decarboxylase